MEHFLDQYGYAAVFLIALVEAVCIPFPSEVTFGFTRPWPHSTSTFPWCR
jgi:membrane protein YqaA with SNARE-associated domain